MKTLKYFLGAWLAVLAMQAFVGCSSDDPVEDEPGIEQGEGTGTDDDDKEDDEELTESAYKPFVTDKRISKIVKGNEYSGTTYEISYDAKGRVKEYLKYEFSKKGDEVINQDMTLYRITYAKNKITILISDPEHPENYSDVVTTLNENGYDDSYRYSDEGYGVSINRDENGNIWQYPVPNLLQYYCTYTDYKNDMSIDMTDFLIHFAGPYQIPSDVRGKRCGNLPATRQSNLELNSPYGDFYNYTFDSKGRVSEIEVVEKTSSYGDRFSYVYITYEE